MGEYIGKIYHETKRRPSFTIETTLLGNHGQGWAQPSLAQCTCFMRMRDSTPLEDRAGLAQSRLTNNSETSSP
jgi:hypothetical protein